MTTGTNLISLDFQGFPVRILRDEKGQPLFNAMDVCRVLGFGNPHQALKTHVDEDDLHQMEIIDSLGRVQKANYVNRPGLYSLILGCRNPIAKPFKRWVTHDVLEAIFDTGHYALPGSASSNRTLYDLSIKEHREIQAAQKTINSLDVPRKVKLQMTADLFRGYGVDLGLSLPSEADEAAEFLSTFRNLFIDGEPLHELLQRAMHNDQQANRRLLRQVDVALKEGGLTLAIPVRSSVIAYLLAGTKWRTDGSWSKPLRSHPESVNKVSRIGSFSRQSVLIPVHLF